VEDVALQLEEIPSQLSTFLAEILPKVKEMKNKARTAAVVECHQHSRKKVTSSRISSNTNTTRNNAHSSRQRRINIPSNISYKLGVDDNTTNDVTSFREEVLDPPPRRMLINNYSIETSKSHDNCADLFLHDGTDWTVVQEDDTQELPPPKNHVPRYRDQDSFKAWREKCFQRVIEMTTNHSRRNNLDDAIEKWLKQIDLLN